MISQGYLYLKQDTMIPQDTRSKDMAVEVLLLPSDRRERAFHLMHYPLLYVFTSLDSHAVVRAPSDALALSNCLVVHPSDFSSGQHVFVKQQYPMTTRYVSSLLGLNGPP